MPVPAQFVKLKKKLEDPFKILKANTAVSMGHKFTVTDCFLYKYVF